MKKRSLIAVWVLLAICAHKVVAQGPPQAPTPGPEQRALRYFEGDWHDESELKPGAMGPGGKMTAVDHNHMLEGGFFMVMHSTSKGPVGEIHELAIMGYDAEKKAYTYNSFSNFGEAQFFTGTLQGDTWTWHAESKMNGQITKQRFTLIEVSPSSYTFRFDVSADGATWTNVVEGKATKVK